MKIYRKQRQIHKTQTSIKSLLQTRSTWHPKFRPYWRRLKTKSLQQQYRAERRSNCDATAIFLKSNMYRDSTRVITNNSCSNGNRVLQENGYITFIVSYMFFKSWNRILVHSR